jgi:type IV pilus assembly protein PilB
LESAYAAEFSGMDSFKTYMVGSGCVECSFTGYNGRLGLYEVITISDTIRQAVTDRVSALQIRAMAKAEGMISLRQDGILKIKSGITTPQEVIKETENL